MNTDIRLNKNLVENAFVNLTLAFNQKIANHLNRQVVPTEEGLFGIARVLIKKNPLFSKILDEEKIEAVAWEVIGNATVMQAIVFPEGEDPTQKWYASPGALASEIYEALRIKGETGDLQKAIDWQAAYCRNGETRMEFPHASYTVSRHFAIDIARGEPEPVGEENLVGKSVGFERVRRITGYLVGDLSRFNNGKRKEEHDRVKHGM